MNTEKEEKEGFYVRRRTVFDEKALSFLTILEIFEQKGRVKKGWFPMNPKRKKEYES